MSKKITSIVLVALMAAALFAVPAAAAEPTPLKFWDFTQTSSMTSGQIIAEKIELVDGTLKFSRPAGNNSYMIEGKLAGTSVIQAGTSYRLNFKFKTDATRNARPYVYINVANLMNITYAGDKVEYRPSGASMTQENLYTFEEVTNGEWKEYTLYFSVPSNLNTTGQYSYVHLGQRYTYSGTGEETNKDELYCKTPVYYTDVKLYEDYNEVKIVGDKMKVHLKGACNEAEYNALTAGKQLISAVYEGTTPVLKSISVPTLANTDFAREHAMANGTSYYTALDYVVDLPAGVQVGDTVKLMLLGNNNLGALAPMASVTITE